MPMPKPKNILPTEGDTFYYPQFFSAIESDRLFADLQAAVSWKQDPILIFGKSVMQPRLTASFGDPGTEYTYSGITMTPTPWIAPLQEIKTRIESESGTKFNSALLNLYRDEKDSMGWHRDNEKELGHNPIIASVSFGAVREFQFRHRNDKELKATVPLEHGSFLLMAGTTQHHWLHSIPKTKTKLGPRLNITFRRIIKT
jgi:alkylated DNA repair dioxygenase AlkB